MHYYLKLAGWMMALATSAVAQADPGQAVRPLRPEGGAGWRLTWSDEFDYPDEKLDEKWVSQNGPSGHILCSRWRENARVENGTLKLLNRKEKRGGQDWTSGSLWTRQDFQYGYFECRYRYAAAEATNNSFWIMSRKEESQIQKGTSFATTRPARGAHFEIDINEGHYPAAVNTNIHNWSDLVEVNGKKRSRSNPRSFPMGTRPDRVVQLEAPVTTSRVRLISDQADRFHIRELRVLGTNRGKGFPSIFKPTTGAESEPIDFARDPGNKVTVSGLYVPPADYAGNNEVANLTDNNPGTSWIAQQDGQKFVEIEFPEPRTIGCVQFLNGWQEGANWRGLLSSYAVQYHNGTDWVDLQRFDVRTGEVDFSRDFHVFGLDWNETDLVFYVDGKEIRRVKNEFCHSPAPVWLSLAIISWHGKVTDAIDGTAMEVDYVRVFQRE